MVWLGLEDNLVLVVMLAGCRSRSDVVFVVDSSSAVDYPSFQSLKSFISDLVLDLAVDSGQTRVGLVTYAGEVEERFNLTRYSWRADMSAAVRDMAYSMLGGYRTGTADAIAYVRQVQCLVRDSIITD